MSAAAGALLFLTLKLAPSQHLVYRQLARRDAADRKFLPIEALYELSREPLWIVFHDHQDWNKAFYLPAETPALPVEGSLPALALPRLYLYRPYYLAAGRLKDFKDFPVDTGSAFFTALLEKVAREKLVEGGLAAAKARADQLLPEVEEGQRLEVYGETLAEFAGHLMSIANEIGRAKRRGIDLCPREQPIPLLEHWRRAFDQTQFFGTYSPPGSFEAVATRNGLEREDKIFAAKELLKRPRWKGDPLADLGVCRP